ncbi:MAG TPA: hypothetical protein VGB85_08695 [Nannocystis sp.]
MSVSRRPRACVPRPACFARVLALVAVCLAVVIPSRASANPGLAGTRHLGMGGASRASTRGAGAMLVNPANLGFTRQFEIEPAYQGNIESNTHGAGILVMDSLLNERLALGLGYVATIGAPRVSFATDTGDTQKLKLVHTAHEVSLPIAINVALGWLAFGVRPKFQYSAMRFEDAEGVRRDARAEQTKFGLDLALTFSARQWVNISVIGQNISGQNVPATTLDLAPYSFDLTTLDRSRVSPVSDYARTLAHGIAVFPTRKPTFSINFDGVYDFTSFRYGFKDEDKYTRKLFAGGVEYSIRDVVPLRIGGFYDSRGRGKTDDRGYIALGVGYFRAAPKGAAGFNLGVGVSRQITGPSPETLIAVSLGILLNPQR